MNFALRCMLTVLYFFQLVIIKILLMGLLLLVINSEPPPLIPKKEKIFFCLDTSSWIRWINLTVHRLQSIYVTKIAFDPCYRSSLRYHRIPGHQCHIGLTICNIYMYMDNFLYDLWEKGEGRISIIPVSPNSRSFSQY